jgi:hypothetical protein
VFFSFVRCSILVLMAVKGGVDRMRHMAEDGDLEIESFFGPSAVAARENALKLMAAVSNNRQQLDGGKRSAGLADIETGQRCLIELEAALGRVGKILEKPDAD